MSQIDNVVLPSVKIMVVGDGGVGKTSLAVTYTQDAFPEVYIPSFVGECMKKKTIFSTSFMLSIFDVGGGEDFDRLRPLSYPQTDVFFICFSIDTPGSLENVTREWYPEIGHYCPNIPIILVGTKLDLRNDQEVTENLKSRGISLVTTEQALEVKEEIGAWSYVECSSKTRENLEYLFDEALKVLITTPKRRRKKRCALI